MGFEEDVRCCTASSRWDRRARGFYGVFPRRSRSEVEIGGKLRRGRCLMILKAPEVTTALAGALGLAARAAELRLPTSSGG